MKAVQLLVFSRISRYCYDEERNCFIPFAILPIKKVKLIAGCLEELVKKSLKMKEKVKTSGWFVSASKEAKAKSEVQDIVDQVLKICYPYVSEANTWTDMRRKINPDGTSLNISLMPQFLPMGEEDASLVLIGVKTAGERSPCSVLLWRTNNHVFCKYGTVLSIEKISSEDGTVSMDVLSGNIPKLVISSTGGSAKWQGQCLGEYYLWGDPDDKVYKQSNTEDTGETKYLAYKDGAVATWNICEEPIVKFLSTFWMYNTGSKDEGLVSGRWYYLHGSHNSDKNVKIVYGPMKACDNITISGDVGDALPDYFGTFKKTNKMFNGKPVFINDGGKYLYSADGDGEKSIKRWHIAEKIGDEDNQLVRSTSAPVCPADDNVEIDWEYCNGSDWVGCNLDVTCNIHTV